MVEEFLAQIFRRRPTQEKKLKAFFEREPEALRELDAFLVAYRPIWEGPKVGGLDGLADAYSQVVGEIMMCRVEFLRTGRYPLASQTEAFESVYADDGRMLSYMLGLGVSQYLWQAHYRLLSFFEECVAAQSPSARTLEVGSGHGILINHVASRASADAVIDVVDISASSIALSKALLTATNPEVARRIRFVESDIARYEAPNPYDFIVLGEVLEHVEAPSGILQALHRVLADDGSLYITTCANCPAVDHVYLFRNVEEIRELIRGSGFTIAQEVVAPTEDKPLEYHERLKLDILYGALLRKA